MDVAQSRAALRRQALEVFGFEGEAGKLIEEMGELTVALMQFSDGRATAEEVYEEMAGVESVLESLNHWAEDEIGRARMTELKVIQTARLQETLDEVLND